MTTIAILPETVGPTGTTYRAVAAQAQSVGKTPGEALDALTAQLDEAEAGTLVVVVQQQRPDRFFTAQQQQRLAELMGRWRAARDAGGPWSAADQAELDALVAAELQATATRAAALVRQLAS
jgi:hypothetical protein